MTTATICEQLADIIPVAYRLTTGERTAIAAALRELAEIRRHEEGRVLSRPATADERAIAGEWYGHLADIEIPPDARAWETAEEVRVEMSVLVEVKR